MEVLETCLYAEDLKAGWGVFLVFNPKATEKEQVPPPHGAYGSVHVAFRVELAPGKIWGL